MTKTDRRSIETYDRRTGNVYLEDKGSNYVGGCPVCHVVFSIKCTTYCLARYLLNKF